MSGDSLEQPNDQMEPERQSLYDEALNKILRIQLAEEEKKNEELRSRLLTETNALIRKKAKSNGMIWVKLKSTAMLALIVIMFSVMLNIISPGILERFFSESYNQFAGVAVIVAAIVAIFLPGQGMGRDETFLDIDKSFNNRATKPDVVGVKSNVTNNVVSELVGVGGGKEDRFPEQSIGASSEFEYSIAEIVSYLGEHIKLAESKASKLLDKGTTYLRRGLYFYIASIVLWQIWGHFVSFDGLVIAGMVSTSIAFIIIEFLAAWFLKQYRSFVDSSMAYMRVQSYFNRYLLLYFAAKEFGADGLGGDAAKERLLKMLSQEIKWPELKDVNANDFNYMVEAMGAMHTSFEKLKGIVQPKTKKGK